MEHQEDSFDVDNLVCTPTDPGLPMSLTHLPLPLPLPPSSSHMIMYDEDLAAQSSAQAVAGKTLEQEFELPGFTSTPTDVELVLDYLRPAINRMPRKRSLFDLYSGPAVVNGDLPTMDPWELPGTIARNNKGGMRDKYYLTDHRALSLIVTTPDELHTPNGFWKKQVSITSIRAGHNGIVGIKRTMQFQPNQRYALSGTKTNWIMNIYSSLAEKFFAENDLVLCHVFEADSPDYKDSRKCLGCHPEGCNGNHYDQAYGAPSNASSNTNNDSDIASYLELFENVLLGDHDLDNSADTGTGNSRSGRGVPPTAGHGQSKKRKKSSDVWDYFTKIFARDIDGNVLTFAACNHCCNILSGSSKNGTSQLARHVCPCKFKPVVAGRNAKDSSHNVDVLSS